MKKILYVLVTISLLILAMGCSSNDSSSKSSSTSTKSSESTKPSTISSTSSINTTASTASPTTTSKSTIVDNSKSAASSSLIEYKSENLGFSFTIPQDWKNKYTVKEDATSLSIFFKPANPRPLDGPGLFFTIIKKTPDLDADHYDTVYSKKYFDINGVTYLIGGPTDIGFDENSPEYSTYKNMKAEIPEILDTIKATSKK